MHVTCNEITGHEQSLHHWIR